MSTENFLTLLNENIEQLDMTVGAIIKATVIDISDGGYVTLSAGLKSEADVHIDEFKNSDGNVDIKVGDVVEVAIEAVENGYGETCLSREKAIKIASWKRLEESFANNDIVTGIINDTIKGGFTVDLDGVVAFLPKSLIDIRPVKDFGGIEKQSFDFKIVKMDKKRNNVVVSRRAVIEAETSEEREQLLETLSDGLEIRGVVKNLTEYGAFVDLGGIDGLLHITDMSWKRLKHPGDMVNVGEEITVKVLSFDKEKQRVSLGLKQLQGDPWHNIASRYPAQTRLFGVVTNVTDYGCFVEIENGIEGLVHMSEMDWTNKNILPSSAVSVGNEVEVMVLEIDEKRRRISLGLKQCSPNPWQEFADNHEVGEKIKGNIRSITDFGIFIGLDNKIDGLIHQTDISWTEPGEKVIREFNRGEELETVILAIDTVRERVSLGLKQMLDNPFVPFFEKYPVATKLDVKVKSIESKRILLDLPDGFVGSLRLNEQTQSFKEGDELSLYVESTEPKGGYLVSMSLYEPREDNNQDKGSGSYSSDGADESVNNIVAELLKVQLGKNEKK